MKTKMTILFIAIALVSFGLYGTGYAYHDGGVARCEGCHTMHNSLDGAGMATKNGRVQFSAGPYLLKGSDASSACLNCHGTGDGTSSYHVSTETVAPGGVLPNQFTPGGDFSWLKQSTDATSYQRGHNIIAADFGYTEDTHKAGSVSPGGSYPTNEFYCTSCHNPHGQTRRLVDGTFVTPAIGTAVAPIEASGSYGAVPADATVAVGAYRLLGGNGYIPKGLAGAPGVTFTNAPPHAVSPSSYNSTTAKGGVRVAYGTGMSEWCANCHGSIHLNQAYVSGQDGLRHPADSQATLGAAIAANYNAYKSSGDLTGDQATSFDPLVPYEEASSDYAALATAQAGTAGPDATDNVMCLSCHRAHASAFNSMTRWDMAEALITDGTAGWERSLGTGVLDRAYYNKTAADFGEAQRILCNKCHAKD